MTAAVTAYVIRLLIGGLMCWCLTAIAGKNACAVPLRMACACFMILLTLTPVLRGGGHTAGLLDYIASVEEGLQEQVEAAQSGLRADVHTGVEAELNALMTQAGYDCHVHLNGGLDADGRYTVAGAVVSGAVDDREALCARLEALTGLQAGQIRFAEEDTP